MVSFPARPPLFLLAVWLLQVLVVDSVTLLKKDTACYGTWGARSCSHHEPACARGKVFILQALRGVKPSSSACAERTPSCLPDPGSCCQPQDGDCMEAYTASHFQQLYKECWNEESCSYRVPQQYSQSCGPDFHHLSGYSQIHYVCLTGSSITDFYLRTPVRGSGVAVAYSSHSSDQDGRLSCRVHSASCSRVSTNVLLYRGGNSQCQSSLPFTTLHLNGDQHFNCSEDPDFATVQNLSTPFTISLEIDHLAKVSTAWVVIQGADSELLSLTCGFPGDTADSAPCPPPDCFTKDRDGTGHYWGSENMTESGRSCQRWDQQYPHEHSRWKLLLQLGAPDLASQHNFCRDPDKEGTPWCYTTDPDFRWEHCNVTPCSEVPIQPPTSPPTTVVSVSTWETTPSTPTPEVTFVPSSPPSNSSDQLTDDFSETYRIVGGVVASVVVVATAAVVLIIIYKCRQPLKQPVREVSAIFNPTYSLHPPGLISTTDLSCANTSPDTLHGDPDDDVTSPAVYVNVATDATSRLVVKTGDNDDDYNHLRQRLTLDLHGNVAYSHLTYGDDVEYSYDQSNEKGMPSRHDVICNAYDVAQPAVSRTSDVYVNYDVMATAEEEQPLATDSVHDVTGERTESM